MNKILLTLLICMLSFNSFCENKPVKKPFRLAANLTASDYFPGKIIFKVRPEFRSQCQRSTITIPSLSRAISSLNTEYIEKKFPMHQPPSQERNSRGQLMVDISLIYELKYNADIPIEKAINILLQDESVLYAEPDYIVIPLYTPNDTGLVYAYHLDNIRAYLGWDISKGDSSIVIGITDTGTDLDHPDLINQIKYNYADPINGVDDDGDGYTDNFMGWDLGDNDNDPTVAAPHGSFVSGFSSAQADNITGAAGTGFLCKYLPVKIASGNYLTKAYEGIVYAADHGCQVINCSWGSTAGGQFGQDIVNYATIDSNRLIVAAAGNNNNDDPFYPASYKYVLSVAGTDSTDTKWFGPGAGSSYGCNIDVSAPGKLVYSTVFDNTWTSSSGTSFASPIVAGIAGIVTWHFPTYSPMQVGEQIRATCDNIDTIALNIPYTHLMGKGRVNLYRALTESAKSARMTDLIITDNNDNSFVANDTLRISGELTNWLAPVSNMNITLTANSTDVTILNGTFNAGNMNTLDSMDTGSLPFLIRIEPTIPLNTKVIFTMTYSDAGGYDDFQCFDVVLNVDYINVKVNDVASSITSKGRIGFNDFAQSQGLGFTYNDGPNMLYEGCFMAGISQTQVSDYTITSPSTQFDHDLVPQDYVRKLIPSVTSDIDLYSTFNDDSAYANKLNVLVTQRTYAWSTPADAKYIMILYTLKNNGALALNSLYTGIFCDWDINNAVLNKADVNMPLKLGYAWDTQTGGTYSGVKVLGAAPFNCYEFDNDGANGSYSIYDGFTKAEKYLAMSTPRSPSGVTGSGNDVSMVVASGPYTINAGDSVRVGFALLAGDSLQVILDAATAADIKYDDITGIHENTYYQFSLDQNYPNPFTQNTVVSFTLDERTDVNLTVYDVAGQKILTVVNEKLLQGKHQYTIDSKKLSSGIYYFTLKAGNRTETKKLVKAK